MAEAKKSSLPSTIPVTDESLVCPLCLEVFKTPKILPCFHTFCEGCLQHLVSAKSADKFPCPSCREKITVPSAGVSAFRNNFYLKPEDLDKARNCLFCASHPRKEIEIYCVQCDVLICVTCLVTKHKQHEAEDVTEARTRLKTQIQGDMTRMDRCVDKVRAQVQAMKKEEEELTDKKAAVKEAILNRHATLLAAIDRYRDEALASLDTVTGVMEAEHAAGLIHAEKTVSQTCKLQRQAQQALNSDNVSDLLTVARGLRSGRGSEDAMHKLTTKQMTTVCRPVLRFSATHDALQRVRDYIGSVAKMKMTVSVPEVSVVEQFRCREDPDTDVYHLCPFPDDSVWVSYEPYIFRNNVASERIDSAGQIINTLKVDVPARVTLARTKGGAGIYPIPQEKNISTYAKLCKSDKGFVFRVDNDLSGKASVQISEILHEDPLKTNISLVFALHCGLHRSFDVDTSEQLFVFLEEGKPSDFQRRVQLYLRSQSEAVATYKPPVTPFQPSDVCFYTLAGQEVLMVADELNDAIHVVNVQDGRLSFLRYLAPGCPLLVQPTALNTDTKGRLWVACRGGRILTCTPTT